jgi:hypothetical protein
MEGKKVRIVDKDKENKKTSSKHQSAGWRTKQITMTKFSKSTNKELYLSRTEPLRKTRRFWCSMTCPELG